MVKELPAGLEIGEKVLRKYEKTQRRNLPMIKIISIVMEIRKK